MQDCPTLGQGATYAETTSGNLNTAPRGWVNNGTTYQMNTDTTSTSTTGRSRITETANIPVRAGVLYSFSIQICVAKGYPGASLNTDLTLTFNGINLGLFHTENTSTNGTLLQPNTYAAFNICSTITPTYRATTTGTVTFVMAFNMYGGTGGNNGINDDYQVTPTFTNCA